MKPDRDPPRLEAMTFGMILDRAFQLYTRDFFRLTGIMIIPQVLAYLNSRLLGSLQAAGPTSSTLPAIIVSLVFSFLVSVFGSAAVTASAGSRYLGKESTILQAYGAAFRRLGVLIGAWIVAFLFVVLGFLVLVPGIFMALSNCLITPVALLEDLSAGRTRRRSKELIKGFRWQALGLAAVFLAGYLALFATLMLGIRLFGGPALQVFLGSIAYRVTANLLAILVAPLASVVTLLVYYNQRIRKEGYDLVFLAEAVAEG